MNQQTKNSLDKVIQAMNMAADYLQAAAQEVNKQEAALLSRISELEEEVKKLKPIE